jgi:predicted Zn-dependent protease
MANRRSPEVTVVVPFIMAALALLFYLITLNPWVSISGTSQPPYASNNLAEVARVSGWTWQPTLLQPLYWLVTLPFQWLPARWVPAALSMFSALCAAGTLGLLARSVAILPRDRTEDQRSRERSPFAILSIPMAWIPPAVAVLVLGLQLSFWEHATAASAEMFKLLLFAYVVRCLLEYRIDDRPVWLYKATFVFAAGMTNSWGMIGYAPLFLAALIWLRGLSFFNLTFLSRVAVFAMAGLLFYLLLPIVVAASSATDITFWQALKYNLGSQKALLSTITFNKYTLLQSDRPLWVLGLPTLLPLLFMSIRWPSYFGDPNKLGVALATLIFHFFHGVLLAVCLWFLLDSQFSPRHTIFGTPVLSLYFLCALAVGYFAGYFLLVFGVAPGKRSRPGLPSIPAVDIAVRGVVLVMLLLAPAALLYRNLHVITAINGPPLKDKKSAPARQYAEASIAGLPPGGGVILSDDIRKLSLVRAALTARKTQDRYLFLDTQSLKWPDYHRFLERTDTSSKWVNYVPKGTRGEIDGASLAQVLYQLAQTNAIYYLHPSFGYYFEAFWLEPQGIVYRLNLFPTNSLLAPSLPKHTIDYNKEFWTRADQNAVGHVLAIQKKQERLSPDNLADRFLAKARLKKQVNWDVSFLAQTYSRARNFWGVEMQKLDALKEAEQHFTRAVELNANNAVAKVNLAWNRHMQSGQKIPSDLAKDARDLFGRYSWDQLMNENGPFDEPRFCFEQGRLFVQANLLRQAAHQFRRVHDLRTNDLPSRLWLAQVYVMTGYPDQALGLINEVQSRPAVYGVTSTNDLEIMSVTASALLGKNEPEKAEEVVRKTLQRHPQDATLAAVATQIFMNFGQYTNAIRLLDHQLQREPQNINVLINKGFAFLQLKRFEEAIPPLTRAMNLETNKSSEFFYSAMFNRAIANLQLGRLQEAREDYQTLQKSFPTSFKVYYGLAEVAYRGKDTNSAIQNYESYLANAPTNTAEAQFVMERLENLRSGSF